MKIKFQYIGLALLMFSMAACKKDNFDAPKTTLNGKLVYNGEPIQVEYDRVSYQLYQYGYGAVGPIGATFAQDGSYSAVLFDGQYKLIIPAGQGPFKWNETSGHRDSLTIDLKGNKTLDLEVTPYYMPRNGMVASRGRNVNASFKTERIITGADAKDIEHVDVYVSKTQFVSGATNVAARVYPNDAIIDNNKIEFTKFITPTVETQDNYFVRLAIKIAGVEDLIFTPVLPVTLGGIENYARVEAENGTLVGGTKDAAYDGASGKHYLTGIVADGDGVDITINAISAGDYVLNVGAGTDTKGATNIVYIDGNVASAKTITYPKQGEKNFDISAVEFNLTAGNHIVSIRKAAASVGNVNIDYLDFFKLK